MKFAGCIIYLRELAQCIGPKSVSFQRNTLRWNMIMDVFTDILSKLQSTPMSGIHDQLIIHSVILVPVNMLWKVQISLRQKIALTGIFSITFIIMVFAVIRVVVVSATSQQPDQTWLYMWSSIEQTVCKYLLHGLESGHHYFPALMSSLKYELITRSP